MPKINVYLPEELAAAVREAQLPVSAVCQAALERAVRDVSSARGIDQLPSDKGCEGTGPFTRFTPRARKAINLADKSARAVPHNFIGTEHILLGVIDEGTNLALRVLAALEIESDDLRGELVASMGPPGARTKGELPFTPLAKQALELTTKEAMSLGHNYVGCEHLLLGLLATEDGLASQVLRRMGLELRTTRRAVINVLTGVVHARATEAAAPPLEDDALTRILRRLDAIEQKLG